MHNYINNLWLPYTQMKGIDLPPKAVRTKGTKITLSDGRILTDCISSWWTACHGYNNKHISKVIKKQLEIMPHVMFGGLVHEEAIKLSNRITKLLKNNLKKVFFSDSGSVAIEIAIKMTLQYWQNKGFPKKSKFIYFKNAYHGDTTGAMALCDPEEGMHNLFKKYLKKNIIANIPLTHKLERELENLINKNSDSIAGIIIEPLVQCAGGMHIYSKRILEIIFKIKKKHSIILIYDEIATGFGRTGSMFAFQKSNTKPDIICLGKALTGGFLSLAATVTNKNIFDAFLSSKEDKEFMHGPTYMANPLACSAANASLDLFENNNVLSKVKYIESFFARHLSFFIEYTFVKNVRVLGAIAVIEIKYISNKRRVWLKKKYIEKGLWVRPLKNVIYFMPAFIISEQELKKIIFCTKKIFEDWDEIDC